MPAADDPSRAIDGPCPPPGSQPLDPTTCVELLATAPLGRVAVSIGALPSVVPVPFVTDGHTIAFPCASGRLADAVRDAVVAFQTDGREPGAAELWTVLAVGRCRISTGHTALEAASAALSAGHGRAPVALLAIERISGWRTTGAGQLGDPAR